MNNFRLGRLFPGVFFLWALSLGVNADPCNPADSDADPQACFTSQLNAVSGGANPFDGTPISPAARACSDPALAAAGEAFCFDAYFCTDHEDVADVTYPDQCPSGTKIDMTVYVPSRAKLNEAAQAVGSAAGPSGSGATARGKPRCKGCKVERKGYARDTKPRCRGCKVERSTAVGGVRFDASPAGDSLSSLGFAPLIVHSHGFGGAKQSDLEASAPYISEEAAEKLWKERGYFVVSFSERGFGTSGDLIRMMDPLKEGLDTNEVVDWAIKHLREGIYEFTFDETNPEHTSSVVTPADWNNASLLMGDHRGRLTATQTNPRLGSTGYSYGGHFQYTATHVPKHGSAATNPKFGIDQRWDAINPQGTWFDLRHALANHDVPKSSWIAIMYEFALQGTNADGQFRQPPEEITEGFTSGATSGIVSKDLLELFKNNSAVNYCDPDNNAANAFATDVDVFHIQGFQDTLFNFNDGYDNALCMRNAGNDVRSLTVLGGHLLPAISPANHSGEIGMSLDEVVHCGRDANGPIRFSVRDMIVDWFEEKLRFQDGAADYIPTVCMVQENLDGTPLISSDYNQQASMDPTADQTRYASEGLTYDSLDDIIIGTDNPDEHEYDFADVQVVTTPALAQSAFVCLHESQGEELLVGIPTLKATVESNAALLTSPLGALIAAGGGELSGTDEPIVYAGIGIRRGGGLPCNGATTLSVETSSGSLDEAANQLLAPIVAPLAETAGFNVGNTAELVHDQIIAIKGYQFPYELPGEATPEANRWQTWNREQPGGGSTTPGEIVGFGCAPNKSAVDPDNNECPLAGEADEFGRLAGVSSRLQAGDQVGLYFFGSSLQYAASADRVPDPDLSISGTVRLPIIPAPGPALNMNTVYVSPPAANSN